MKRCLKCKTIHSVLADECPDCGSCPDIVDGFEAYAPEFAHGGGGFKEGYFSELSRLEDTNFWFRFRNKLVLWALKAYRPDFGSFLEIGCGTGYVLSGVSRSFPKAKLCGSEIFTAGLGFAVDRLPTAEFLQIDAREIPFWEEFEVIGAFDVLEHIEEDELVLKQIHEALMPGGLLLLTVPQHDWMWSFIDEYAFHVRRYAAQDLHKKIESAGFLLIRSTSFVTTLLPAMILSRFLKEKVSGKDFDATAELKISPWLNSAFINLLALELAIIKMGFDFPLGGSRLVIAKKQ